MGIDERRHVLIKDRFEDAVVEIAEAKDIIHKVAAVVKQDREKISQIGGKLDGAFTEIAETQDTVTSLAGFVADERKE